MGMERLSSVLRVRRRTVLADASLLRGAAARARVRVGVAHDSDVKALSQEISALDDRIRASVKEGVDGMALLLARYTILENSFREWAVDEGYDENMTQPWYRSSTLGAKGEASLDDFKERNASFGREYAKLKYPGLPSDLPSDYGAPLPPVEPGGGGGAEPSPPGPGSAPAPAAAAIGGSGSTTMLLMLVAAAVAAVGGYLLLKGTA